MGRLDMEKRDLLRTSAKGGGIVAASLGCRYVIAFATQATLARILEPEVFGYLAFATTVAMFLNAFTDLHGGEYVVYQKKSAEKAINVAFTLEVFVSLFCFLCVLLLAPAVMQLLGKSQLTVYVQFLSCAFFYNPLCRPRALLERNLSFAKSAFPFVASQLVAACIAISLAFGGYGIWSLLWWRLSVLIGEILILWIIAPYRPRLEWDSEYAKGLAGFSTPLVGASVLTFVSYNLDYFIIGQVLEDGDTQLGYYWLGFQAGVYFLSVRQVLYNVLFPIMSRLEDERFKARTFIRFTHAVAAIYLIPTMIAVYFGRELVLLVYGSRWEAAVFPFQVILVTVLMRVINSNNGYYLHSSGITRTVLVVSALKVALFAPAAYFATIRFGINGTAIAVLLVEVFAVTFTFERYIKPLTGRGAAHFFLRPVSLAVLALCMSYWSFSKGSLGIRLGIFAALLVVTYRFVLQPVFRDVQSAVRTLRCQPIH